ncbi:exodeoxyribonuclease V gamma subunit [Methylomarinovum caldicuralii]|uniref:RecBCD enzyme subunit RecC n=1 Tax=Methylomarinovum caldicuralii TaxID=438856 RepID=A0AAU9C2T6_9GAMM|nr:exodeoxyribonuclease V subunit gamma [Methylomarinovum caldicuralii]BCX81444.1 exodeoxyribonuclease V gamma subunit [Methylomarinovum caldicuralii]
MFALHTANRTEDLFRQLVVVLEHYEYGPFDPIHFLIQGRGMERWLQMQLACQWGAAARICFDFPQRFFAELAQRLGLRLNDAAFERSRLGWLIDALLARDEFQRDPLLERYLAGPGPRLRRFQLARQLAQLFDQYQIQRRDWLAAWARGEASGEKGMDPAMERWQANLWRLLYARLGGHRGELWQALLDALKRPPAAVAFPPSVHLFGISFLPPLMIEVLAALADHSDVHLYLLTPTEGYWADLPGKRRQALERIEGEALPGHHPLLVALGRRGAQFQRLTLDCLEPALESSCFFRHSSPATLLQHLQNDLADGQLSAPPGKLPVGMELHRCHTPLREVEVARDRILAALAGDPSLRLEEIAVMAPDIGVYQAYLEAVFADLPHHIADRSLGQRNPLLEVLAEALGLLAGRFEWEAVLELLGRPPVRERFGLSAAQLPVLENWVRGCAIRWGLDGAQRQALGLPAEEYNSWRLGVDRMLLGWMADLDAEWHDVVPFPEVEGQAGEALLRLADFVQTLQRWWRRWQTPRTLAEWGEQLFAFSHELLADTPETCAARQALADLLDTLPPAEDYPQAVDLTVMLDWLRSRVEESVSDDFLSGGVTCCTLLPMRVVPFRLTVILGLDDGTFPRREVQPAFDLIAAHPRLGDRDVRLEQRYQFLEVLLSTRERLVLTCQGLTPEKNEVRPPAQVVVELGDVLSRYGIEEQDWIFDHPSHPFHPDYFRPESAFSVPDPARYPVARALLTAGEAAALWPADFALDEPAPVRIEVADLLDFHRDPQDWFCRQRLQLAALSRDRLPDPREPFEVDGLESWRMRCRILAALAAGEAIAPLLRQAQLAGEWPQGEAGRQCFAREQAVAEQLHRKAEDLRRELGAVCDAGWRQWELAGVTLEGRVDHLHEGGLLIVEAGKLKGKYLFDAWLRHLLAQSLGPWPTWLVALEDDNKRKAEKIKVCRFDPVPDWEARLSVWVRHFRDHWNRPSPWVPQWGCHWLRRAARGDEAPSERWWQITAKAEPPPAFVLLFGRTGAGAVAAQACRLYPELLGGVADAIP